MGVTARITDIHREPAEPPELETGYLWAPPCFAFTLVLKLSDLREEIGMSKDGTGWETFECEIVEGELAITFAEVWDE